MRFRTVLACGLLGTACVAGPTAANAETTSVDYDCKGRMRLHVTFDSDSSTATVEAADVEQRILQGGPDGDGFLYSSGKFTLRGSGDKASWQVGKLREIPCWIAP